MTRSLDNKSGRAYRSHLQPACVACRRRKSRCVTYEGQDGKCSLCVVHGSECIFPSTTGKSDDQPSPNAVGSTPKPARQSARSHKRKRHHDGDPPDWAATAYPSKSLGDISTPVSPQQPPETACASQGLDSSKNFEQPPTALRLLGETDHQSSHIIGPMAAHDAEVVQDYLSILPLQSSGQGQTVRPTPYSMSSKGPGEPVLYMTVQKSPVGMVKDTSAGFDQCRVVEKLVEPFSEELIDLFFEKTNNCFPLLDEAAFRKQFMEDKKSIPPTVIANVYASTLIFWKTSPKLATHRCPDIRYVWLQSSEAFIHELYQSPGISTIICALLDVGGRPTTSMTGNAMTIGSVLPLAHSLGLNRNPLAWPLPDREKYLRVRVWWAIVIHDRWCSFAYGTPPQINRAHCDVPVPTIEQLSTSRTSSQNQNACEIFIALCKLTVVLGTCLEHVYDLHLDGEPATHQSVPQLEIQLHGWEELLPKRIRHSVIHGVQASASAAEEDSGLPNLRLGYLAVRLLIRRLDMDAARRSMAAQTARIAHKRNQAQRAAEDIVFFVQGLREAELKGFWLPTSAFILASAATFLVRCALEDSSSSSPAAETIVFFGNNGNAHLRQNRSLTLVQDFLHVLRSHRDAYGWDLGDICLAQCNDIVERLQAATSTAAAAAATATTTMDRNIAAVAAAAAAAADGGGGCGTGGDDLQHAATGPSSIPVPAHAQAPSEDWVSPFDMALPDDLFPSLWDVFNSEALN